MDEGTEFMSSCPPIHCNASVDDFTEWAKKLFGDDLGPKVPPLYKIPLEVSICICIAWCGPDLSEMFGFRAACAVLCLLVPLFTQCVDPNSPDHCAEVRRRTAVLPITSARCDRLVMPRSSAGHVSSSQRRRSTAATGFGTTLLQPRSLRSTWATFRTWGPFTAPRSRLCLATPPNLRAMASAR